MNLKRIVSLKIEIENVMENFIRGLKIEIFSSKQDLWDFLQDEKIQKPEVLLIAATDETIALGKELGIATMAYANPDFPDQSYSGVEMIVEGFDEVDADFLEKVYQRWHHIPWTILETERCVVKELCLDDIDGLFELYADDEIGEYTESLYPYEEEKEYQSAYINNMYRYFGYGMWLVFSRETGKIIGRAGLEHREYYEEVELELGYLIGRPYQGQGYATEICKAILEYAKEHTGFRRINSLIEEGNNASIALTKKLGFTYVEDFELDGKRMHRFIKSLDS